MNVVFSHFCFRNPFSAFLYFMFIIKFLVLGLVLNFKIDFLKSRFLGLGRGSIVLVFCFTKKTLGLRLGLFCKTVEVEF